MSVILHNTEFTIEAIQTRISDIDAINPTVDRFYIPITHYREGSSSLFSTYDENLTIKNNAQYTLTFSINKYINNKENPTFYLITEGRRLRLTTFQKIIDFVITSITPKVTNKNVVLNVSCQDAFSYETSKMNISISYESNGSKTYYEHLTEILNISSLGNRYELDPSLKPEGQAPIFTNPFALDIGGFYDALKTSSIIENSTVYGAFTQLATDFNALLDITYPYYYIEIDENGKEQRTLSKTKINFINIRNSVFQGYTLRPETNLNSFSVTRKADNLSTVMYVKGGTDSDNMPVNLMPPMPQTIQEFFEKQIINPNPIDFWTLDSKEWRRMYREQYPTLLFQRRYVSSTEELSADAVVDYYWRALTDLVPSGGNLLYNFDHFKENGLIGNNEYNYLNQQFSIDLRSLNIKQGIFSSQYYRLLSELSVAHTAELDYATMIASDIEKSYDYDITPRISYASQESNFYKILNEYNNIDNYFNNILSIWTDNNYEYIQNYKMFHNVSAIPGRTEIQLEGLINDGSYELVSEATVCTDLNLGDKKPLLFNFKYLGAKASEIANLYNQACKDYIKEYNNLEILFQPFLDDEYKYVFTKSDGSTIAFIKLEDVLYKDDEFLEDIFSTTTGSCSLYINYAYYRERFKTLRTKIGSYYISRDGSGNITKTHYRLGIYFVYLQLLYVLDNMRMEDNQLIWEDWLASFPLKINLSNLGIGVVQFKEKNTSFNPSNYVTVWSKHPVSYNLQELKQKTEKEKDNFWKKMYNYFGDYITESSFTDEDQLTSEGLYIMASKQFSAYYKPTVDYSTTVINQSEILGFDSKLGLGDIIHLYNKDLLSEYSGEVIVEISDVLYFIDQITIKRPSIEVEGNQHRITYETITAPINHYSKTDLGTVLYIPIKTLEQANSLLTEPIKLLIGNVEATILSKKLNTKEKPIPLQVTGLSTKLRSGTTQITVANNKTVNALLGRMLRHFK